MDVIAVDDGDDDGDDDDDDDNSVQCSGRNEIKSFDTKKRKRLTGHDSAATQYNDCQHEVLY